MAMASTCSASRRRRSGRPAPKRRSERRTVFSTMRSAIPGGLGSPLFGVWQLAILRLLWRSYRVSGQAAGVAFWVMTMAMAFFQGNFDTPYRAIPFYLLVGMAAAPALRLRVLRQAHLSGGRTWIGCRMERRDTAPEWAGPCNDDRDFDRHSGANSGQRDAPDRQAPQHSGGSGPHVED